MLEIAPYGAFTLGGSLEFHHTTVMISRLVKTLWQAFTNGWMGCETFGRVSCIAVTKIEPQERDVIAALLTQHFVDIYGAPSIEAARRTALDEIDQMADLCVDHSPNTLLTVTRELTPAGVRESFRMIEAQQADIMQFAVHGHLDDEPHSH
ncbi:DUF6505 family protein [bacterium]|nr:DUF6505 family protein [bacterium]